ncbi:unnamed protein product [Pieris macdunnoughi]|uniref:Uncharacterized protein n=1 Tax=Pieris macdunnoughi TaxID=345717 RepID=A0A821RK85_9NEOP|nr:unnamed protein product [Pieris macdunnoughi]
MVVFLAAFNDIIGRSLAAVNVLAILESTNIARDGGKRPEGMSLIHWWIGRDLKSLEGCKCDYYLPLTFTIWGIALESYQRDAAMTLFKLRWDSKRLRFYRHPYCNGEELFK